jgi:uncharacterized protein YjbI with pentapeptide repeats
MTQISRDRGTFRLDLHGAYLRHTDFRNFNLEGANLSGADFTEASFRGANFKNADLKGTILRGADLTDVTNLTGKQLDTAIIDDRTQLPAYLVDSAIAE